MQQRGRILRLVSYLLLPSLFVVMVPGVAEPADTPIPLLQQSIPQPATAKDPNVLTLDEAVLTALANHPNLKAAREQIGAQEAVVGQQMAAYYPTVTFNNSYRTAQTREGRRSGGRCN